VPVPFLPGRHRGRAQVDLAHQRPRPGRWLHLVRSQAITWAWARWRATARPPPMPPPAGSWLEPQPPRRVDALTIDEATVGLGETFTSMGGRSVPASVGSTAPSAPVSTLQRRRGQMDRGDQVHATAIAVAPKGRGLRGRARPRRAYRRSAPMPAPPCGPAILMATSRPSPMGDQAGSRLGPWTVLRLG
jgi:hypothetical protein